MILSVCAKEQGFSSAVLLAKIVIIPCIGNAAIIKGTVQRFAPEIILAYEWSVGNRIVLLLMK